MMPSLSAIRVGSTAVVLIVFLSASIISLSSIGRPTYWFPTFVTLGGTLAAAITLITDLRKMRAGESVLDGEMTDLGASVSDIHEEEDRTETNDSRSVQRRVFTWVAWFLALPALSLVIPFFFASLIWLAAVLRIYAQRKWIFILISVGAFGLILNLLVILLDIELPPTVLTDWG